ncbi:DUF6481 family protein [Rhizorhapis sp. SPR117]|uniref:DUF6481 family protein n=1 Tax=Rhizorhapis sp. SPR117 TaxID=2912611 RepID=UPI001F3D8EE7|nr:DUF6481 family protein [Rhizorhapis sp. SPR117]
MASYKDPGFQERVALAQKARQRALEQLRAKPPVDEAVLAKRKAARIEREAAQAEKARARKEALEQAKADKLAQAAEAEAAAQIAKDAIVATEAEKKLARDAQYAARKKRKSRG